MDDETTAREVLSAELEKTGVFDWNRQRVADALMELEAMGCGGLNLCITMTDSICHFPSEESSNE